MDKSRDLILKFNAEIDLFGNLVLRKVVSKREDIYLILKHALQNNSIRCVIVFKDKKRVREIVDSLEKFLHG